MKQSIGSGRGSVYNIIMKALQSGDKYGYEICQEVENQTNGKYILKQPSLYSGLKRLESQKLVESYWGDSDIGGRRHYYKLTDAGRKKIESTNFSWEDERENIVDNFFKKSELDQNIDNIQQSITQAKNDVKSAIETNEQISSFFSDENSKNDNMNANQFAHKVNENQYDLFSYSNDAKNKPNQTQSLFDFLPANEQTATSKQETTSSDVTLEKSTDNQTEKSILDIEHSLEKIEQNINISNEPSQNNSNENQLEQKSVDSFDYNSFFENKKTNSFSETKEEFVSSPQSCNDLQSCPTLNDDTIIKNDDFDIKYAEFRAMFASNETNSESQQTNENNNITNNRQEEISKPTEQTFSESTSLSDEQIRLEQERRMSDVLSGNIGQEQSELKITFDSNNNADSQAQIDSSLDSKNIIESNNDDIKSINFKSIFGDLYDDREQQEKIEAERQKFLNTYFPEKSNESDFQSLEQNLQNVNENKPDELPRYDMSNNINYSLTPSEDYTPPKLTNSPINETKPTYVPNEIASSSNFNSKNNVSFDKKCKSRGYNFNDYEIRYLRQTNVEEKQTKFVKVNKLNFFANITTSLIALIVSLVCFITLKQSLNHIQTLFYILDFTLIGLFIVYSIFTYLSDPNRRGVIKNFKKKIWLNLLICILAIVAITCFNAFILNMNITNLSLFSASFIIPTIIVILCLLNHFLKILLHKFPNFTK